MNTENLIPAKKFCSSHRVELSFINSLKEYGLIQITELNDEAYLHTNQLQHIEKYLRLYYDLDINFEGIEAITHLLERIGKMQAEITVLKNRIKK